MVKKWWILLLVLVLLGAGIVYKESNLKTKTTVKPLELGIYQNEKGKYEITVPKTWKEEEASDAGIFVARTTFKRQFLKEKAGNIGEIDITVIATPSSTQPFSSWAEFENWKNKPDQEASGTGIIKLKNESVGGVEAIRLAEVDMVPENISQSWWSVTTWFIKNNINYYVNMMGEGALGGEEYGIFNKLLASFKWL